MCAARGSLRPGGQARAKQHTEVVPTNAHAHTHRHTRPAHVADWPFFATSSSPFLSSPHIIKRRPARSFPPLTVPFLRPAVVETHARTHQKGFGIEHARTPTQTRRAARAKVRGGSPDKKQAEPKEGENSTQRRTLLSQSAAKTRRRARTQGLKKQP